MTVRESLVDVDGNFSLWVQEQWVTGRDGRDAPAVVLVMGANAAGPTWPQALVDRLATRYRVVRYDHRDTGRSTRGFDEHPYRIADLAGDVVAVLDALHIDRAYVIGMSMGGYLVQLLLLDHADRLRSAVLFGCGPLDDPSDPGIGELPGPREEIVALWATMADPRTPEEDLQWSIRHWQALAGPELPFAAADVRALEDRLRAHSRDPRRPTAHAVADPSGLDRGAELAAVTVPTLVVDAPQDPVAPPPNAARLAAMIGSARWVSVPGLGHALPPAAVGPLLDVIEPHLAAVDRR